MQILTQDQSETLLRKLDLQTSFVDAWGLGIPPRPASKHQWKQLRNVTAYLLMLDAGLRVGEVVRLTWPDVIYANAPVLTLDLPAAAAKGKHPRSVPLSVRLQQAILRYYSQTPQRPPTNTINPLIPSNLHAGAITTRSLERIIESAAMTSLGFPVHPHMLRHTFATRIMKVTNMPTVQALLGHRHLSSTQIYTHPNSDDKRNAIDNLPGFTGPPVPAAAR